jgi:hypothetical protein
MHFIRVPGKTKRKFEPKPEQEPSRREYKNKPGLRPVRLISTYLAGARYGAAGALVGAGAGAGAGAFSQPTMTKATNARNR